MKSAYTPPVFGMNADPMSAPVSDAAAAVTPDAAATDAIPKGYTPGKTAADAVMRARANTRIPAAALLNHTVDVTDASMLFLPIPFDFYFM